MKLEAQSTGVNSAMRCPECEQRNSVAAYKCKFCGANFKRKSMPIGKKVALLCGGGAIVGLMYLSMMLPKMVDPGEQLTLVARRVAAGPKSPEDAKEIKIAFNNAVENMLRRYGSGNSTALSAKLKASLPPSAFEVLVVDLPKGLKLVEIDTILQASDFMVMKGTNDTRVFPLPGFEVYDDARAVNDQAGPVLVLLGHTGGQLPHRPIVRTYALLPDSIEDDSKNMVPAFTGEGTAKFVKDTADLAIDLALPSVAQLEKISLTPPPSADKMMHLQLRWKESRYQPELSASPDLQSYLLLLARNLKYPEFWPASAAYLGASATKLLKENASPHIQGVEIKKSEEKRKSLFYVMDAGRKKFEMELKPMGTSWQLAEYKITEKPVETPLAATTPAPVGNPVVNQNDKNAPIATSTSTPPTSSTTAVPTTTATPTNITTSTSTETSTPIPSPNNSSVKSNVTASTVTQTKAAPHTVPTSLLAHLPGPAVAGSKSKTNLDSIGSQKNTTKGTGTSWLGEDDDKPDSTTKKPADDPKTKKNQDANTASKNQNPSSTASTSSVTGSARIIDNGTSSVRLRSGPRLNARPLTEIPAAASIQIIGQENGWYKVKYGKKTGYVFGPLVDMSKSAYKPSEPPVATLPASTKPPARQERKPPKNTAPVAVVSHPPVKAPVDTNSNSSAGATVVRRPMNVRDDNRHKIGLVQPGDRVVVLSGITNERYKVRLPDGRIGWVHKDALNGASVSIQKTAPEPSADQPPEFVP